MKTSIILSVSIIILSCNQSPSNDGLVKPAMDLAAHQLETAISLIPDTFKNYGPVSTFEDGQVKYMKDVLDWRVGFFPGSLWYMYDYMKDDQWKRHAERFTNNIEDA